MSVTKKKPMAGESFLQLWLVTDSAGEPSGDAISLFMAARSWSHCTRWHVFFTRLLTCFWGFRRSGSIWGCHGWYLWSRSHRPEASGLSPRRNVGTMSRHHRTVQNQWRVWVHRSSCTDHRKEIFVKLMCDLQKRRRNSMESCLISFILLPQWY